MSTPELYKISSEKSAANSRKSEKEKFVHLHLSTSILLDKIQRFWCWDATLSDPKVKVKKVPVQ